MRRDHEADAFRKTRPQDLQEPLIAKPVLAERRLIEDEQPRPTDERAGQ